MKIQDVLDLPALGIVSGFTEPVLGLLAARSTALEVLNSRQGASQFDLAGEAGKALAARLATVAKVRANNNLLNVDMVLFDGAPIALVKDLSTSGHSRVTYFSLDDAASYALAVEFMALRKPNEMHYLPPIGGDDDADALLLSELGPDFEINPANKVSNLVRKDIDRRIVLECRRPVAGTKRTEHVEITLFTYSDSSAAIQSKIHGTDVAPIKAPKSFVRYDSIKAARAAFAAAITDAVRDTEYDVTVHTDKLQHVVLHAGTSDAPKAAWILSRQDRNDNVLPGTNHGNQDAAAKHLIALVDNTFSRAVA